MIEETIRRCLRETPESILCEIGREIGGKEERETVFASSLAAVAADGRVTPSEVRMLHALRDALEQLRAIEALGATDAEAPALVDRSGPEPVRVFCPAPNNHRPEPDDVGVPRTARSSPRRENHVEPPQAWSLLRATAFCRVRPPPRTAPPPRMLPRRSRSSAA